MAQILQVLLSYKVCSTIPPKFVAFRLFILVSVIFTIIHQQPVAMLRRHLRLVFTDNYFN